MPRLLSASNDGDCDFATKFADGVQNELRLVKGHQEQFDTGDLNPGTTHLRSVFGFCGKSTLLIESIRPRHEGTPHLSIQLGVPGCGKSTFMSDYKTFLTASIETLRDPSLLSYWHPQQMSNAKNSSS